MLEISFPSRRKPLLVIIAKIQCYAIHAIRKMKLFLHIYHSYGRGDQFMFCILVAMATKSKCQAVGGGQPSLAPSN